MSTLKSMKMKLGNSRSGLSKTLYRNRRKTENAFENIVIMRQSPIKYHNSASALSTTDHGSSTSKSLSMNMKAMKTLLILLLGFYVCWLPLIVYFLTFASKKYNNLTIYILMFVACCNAVIDPLVYAFRNREFYKALLFNFTHKRSPSTNTCNNVNNHN